MVEVALQPREGALSGGDMAVFVAFGLADEEGATLRIEVSEFEPDGFATSDSGGVEGFEESTVAQAKRFLDVGEVEKFFHLVTGEAFFGESVFSAREFEVGCRVGREIVVAAEVGEEVLHCSETVLLGFDGEGLAVAFAEVVKVSLIRLEDFLGDLVGVVEVAKVSPFEEVEEAASSSGDGAGFVVSDVEVLKPEVAAGGEVLALGGLEFFGAGFSFASAELFGVEVSPVGVVLKSFFAGHTSTLR